ncbi:MAG: ATP-binding domain-containing protein [Anaerolineae bacterium]|nr:ATP-binding domain-containing protein [Anaerolineae bacterium]
MRLSQNYSGESLALREFLSVWPMLSQAVLRNLVGEAPELLADHLFDRERIARLDAGEQVELALLVDMLLQLDEHKADAPAVFLNWVLTKEAAGGLCFQQQWSPDAKDRAVRFLKMSETCADIASFLDELDAMSGEDPLSQIGHERVQLMTLHQAKGLEFRLVFMVGMDTSNTLRRPSARQRMGEERRLAYVGCMRATDVLCVLYSQTCAGQQVRPSGLLQACAHLPSSLFCRSAPDWAQIAVGSSTGVEVTP